MRIDGGVAKRNLRRGVEFAKDCEDVILKHRQQKPLGMLTYSTLIAQRRLAAGIERLGFDKSYEGRILLRSMIEHYYNLSWVRLKNADRRASRFVKFHALERLKLLEALPEDMRPPDYDRVVAYFRKRRTAYRNLFRETNQKTGVRYWVKSWATTPSFEGRVNEVQSVASAHADQILSFTYMLYRAFSGPTHGSAEHMMEIIRPTRLGFRPKDQPDRRPEATIASAAVFLLGTLSHASQVLGFSRDMDERLATLKGTAFTAFAIGI